MGQLYQLALAAGSAVTSPWRKPVVDQNELTWSATLDPQDATHEIEITDEMVCRAIAEIEGDQVYPFGAAAANGNVPIARKVHKADVIPFPERVLRAG